MSNLKRAFIDPNLCRQCQECPPQEQCPVRAIEEEEDGFRYVSPFCTGCSQCLVRCPHRAIKMI